MNTEELEAIAAAAVHHAKEQVCVYCGQHRVYTHLPRCLVARFESEQKKRKAKP